MQEISTNTTNNAKLTFIKTEKEKKLVDYHAPDGSSTFSISKSALFPQIYQVTPSPYPVSETEIREYLDFLNNQNEQQLFIEILRAYAFGAYIPAIISCRSLLETIVDKVCTHKGIDLSTIEKSGALKPKWLTEKIKNLQVGEDLKDFILFNNDFAKKAVHEIFSEYGRVFDKTKTTILLSCTLLIIKQIKEKYYEQPTTAKPTADSD